MFKKLGIEEMKAIRLPKRLKDLERFTIPYGIGVSSFDKVLCDFGASINLTPLFMFKKLGIGKVKATNIILQLANRF